MTRSRPTITRSLFALILVGSGVFFARDAEAIPPVLRGASNPWVFKFGIGPGVNIDDHLTQFKMSEEIGYHFSGTSEGPALGFSLGESVGRDAFTFQMGPDFWWDIQPSPSLALFLAPMFHVGYSLLSVERGRTTGNDAYHFFDMKFGFEVSLIINDRGVVFFRPFGMNIFIGDWTAVRYDIVFGGGATF